LVVMDPTLYSKYVVFEGGRKVIYVAVLRAIYGMLDASLLWYKKFRRDLEKIGFVFNPYEPCVANRVVKGKQHTVRFHVDDVLSSHVYATVNDEFHKWLNKMYGTHGEVKVSRGKVHDYLGMTLDFSEDGVLKVRMKDYIVDMIESFPEGLRSTDMAMCPASGNLFEKGKSKELSKERKEAFHTFVAKGLFLA